MQQMKIAHSHGFSEAELAEYRPVVYKNVLDFAQRMVVYMKMAGIECVEHQNRVCFFSSFDIPPSALPPPNAC